MTTDIQRFEHFKDQILKTWENIQEDGEEGEWFIIDGVRIDDFSMSIDEENKALKLGGLGWAQSAFDGEPDVRQLFDAKASLTTKLIVHKDVLSEDALEEVREGENK